MLFSSIYACRPLDGIELARQMRASKLNREPRRLHEAHPFGRAWREDSAAACYLLARPRLLPTPMAKSQPVCALKRPAFPEVMSRKLALEQFEEGPLPQML
jgi:hypothetical protein